MSAVENYSVSSGVSSGVLAVTLGFRIPRISSNSGFAQFSYIPLGNSQYTPTYYFVVYPRHDKTLEGAARMSNSGWGDGGSGTNAEYLCILKHV